MNCEMCGRNDELKTSLIEGVRMNVCQNCSKYGRNVNDIRQPKYNPSSYASIKPLESNDEIVSNFAQILKQERNKRNMEQIDFAKLLSEKESLLHKMESGHYIPSLDTAKKIAKILKVKLIESTSESPIENKAKASGPLTIGDLIKKRK